VLFFQFEEGKASIEEGGTNSSVPVEMKVLDRNAMLITQQNCALNYVSKFTNIPRPGVSLKCSNTILIQYHSTTT